MTCCNRTARDAVPCPCPALLDGTYLVEVWGLQPLTPSGGYWVATRPITIADAERGQTIGVWTRPDGSRDTDLTVWLAALPEARELARAHSQIAVWDIAHGVAIPTDHHG